MTIENKNVKNKTIGNVMELLGHGRGSQSQRNQEKEKSCWWDVLFGFRVKPESLYPLSWLLS